VGDIILEAFIEILFLLGMTIFCGEVIALNYIDETTEWLNKRNDKEKWSMKEKNTMWLCMRYSGSCKLCPRNKKCDEEIEKERLVVIYDKVDKRKRTASKNYKGTSKRFRRKSRRYS
jgi:hypothetical protein